MTDTARLKLIYLWMCFALGFALWGGKVGSAMCVSLGLLGAPAGVLVLVATRGGKG